MTGDSAKHRHGIRPNLGQFCQQLLQVFFVGLTIGLERARFEFEDKINGKSIGGREEVKHYEKLAR